MNLALYLTNPKDTGFYVKYLMRTIQLINIYIRNMELENLKILVILI